LELKLQNKATTHIALSHTKDEKDQSFYTRSSFIGPTNAGSPEALLPEYQLGRSFDVISIT